jgi:hypothetical protein
MSIRSIVISVDRESRGAANVVDVELGADQASLVPGVGDGYVASGYSMIVRSRRFEFIERTLWVFLEGES